MPASSLIACVTLTNSLPFLTLNILTCKILIITVSTSWSYKEFCKCVNICKILRIMPDLSKFLINVMPAYIHYCYCSLESTMKMWYVICLHRHMLNKYF